MKDLIESLRKEGTGLKLWILRWAKWAGEKAPPEMVVVPDCRLCKKRLLNRTEIEK